MYSVHIGRKILGIKKKERLSFVEAGKRFGMSANTIFKWTKRINPNKKWEKGAIKIDMEALKQDVKENPDSYQYERAKKFGVSQNCICKGLKRLGVSYKKNVDASESRRAKAYYL
jgi:transposase